MTKFWKNIYALSFEMEEVTVVNVFNFFMQYFSKGFTMSHVIPNAASRSKSKVLFMEHLNLEHLHRTVNIKGAPTSNRHPKYSFNISWRNVLAVSWRN
jgi:hypothetical protein